MSNEKEVSQCDDCVDNKGVFDLGKSCCRERHYKMTLSVSPTRAAGELKEIRKQYGVVESDRLAEIKLPPKKAPAAKPVPKRETATLSF